MSAECLVMAKPIGPLCNLRCAYCYYLEKGAPIPDTPAQGQGRPKAGVYGDVHTPAQGAAVMPDDLLERYISQRIEASPGPVTHFEWHGGEPTLLGIGFFKKAAAIQRAHRPKGRKITNGIQTNGVLIDDEWADFLSREGFSVGLSMDGPADLHDVFRRTAKGEPTHARVMGAFRALAARAVTVNVLCVLHQKNAAEPDRVYDFFLSLGVRYLQFLPLAGRAEAAEPEVVGAFLCRVFDRWIRADVGRIVVQDFDEALRPLYGVPHSLCVHRETCGDVAVLERDGGFYACDHFVDEAHRIGSVRERGLAELASDPRMVRFGAEKRDALSHACLDCVVLDMCNGGCPKDRTEGGRGPSRLCPAYAMLFGHCRPELARLAAHMKAGRSLRSFRAGDAGGSGVDEQERSGHAGR